MVLIFGALLDSPTAAIALGLTCSSFYKLMKIFFPKPIYSWAGISSLSKEESYWDEELVKYIGDFVGSEYRPDFGPIPSGPFLRKSVYGDLVDDNDYEVVFENWRRYLDWKTLHMMTDRIFTISAKAFWKGKRLVRRSLHIVQEDGLQ